MVLNCFTWIHHLLKKITGDPDDATGNKDLSTTFLGQENRISKKWWMLTSLLSLNREHPRGDDRQLILRYFCGYDDVRISVIDGNSEKECKIRDLKSATNARVVSCYNGLILLTSCYPLRQHIVLDPLSNKIITRTSPLFSGGYPCGLFFHPFAEEYRILNAREISTDCYEYHLYLSGDNTWRKIANPRFDSGPPCCWDKKKVFKSNPAITNGALHWFMGRILIFNMFSEELCFKSLPFRKCYGKKGYCLCDLLVDEEGRLCLCYMVFPEPVMDIWILEDYASWSWTRKYSVDLDWDTIEYPFKIGTKVDPYILTHVRAVSIHKEELVIFWMKRGMFSYDLGCNTIEKINVRKSEAMHDYQTWINHGCYGNAGGFMAYKATTNDFRLVVCFD